MNLYGELLDQPQLRFDYSSPRAQDTWAKRGLARFGPYDSALFGRDRIRAVVLFPRGSEHERDVLTSGLQRGEAKFEGFERFFRVPLSFVEQGGIPFASEENLRRCLNDVASGPDPPDIVFVILRARHSQAYVASKAQLLANGIPSQMVLVERLTEARGRQYVLENLALAGYAKVGGTPWTVAAPSPEEEVILGVSRALDASKKYLVGYVVLFTRDGDFLFVSSSAPVVEWEDYIGGLSEMVRAAVEQFEKDRGTPSSVIVHFNKNPGRREIDAITEGLRNAAKDIPFAIIHLNEFSNFRLFDSRHPSYVPPRGLKVNLGALEALILLDGLRNGIRRRVGVPRVLDVRMDRRSTISHGGFPRLVQQVSDLAYVNWRGFNAAAIPITLNYSKLIARMLAEIGIEAWNEVVAEGRLRDKAWFL